MNIKYLIILIIITAGVFFLHSIMQKYLTKHNSLTAVPYRAKSWKFHSDNIYKFDYLYINSSWRAYIRRTPDLGIYRDNYVVTNRVVDHNQYYICITRPITSLSEIKKISHEWADKMQLYINREK